MWRQGDILIVEADDWRANVTRDPDTKKVANGIVMLGEVTGHSHAVRGGATVLEDAREQIFIDATETFELFHDEHDTIVIPEGFYRVIRQREYGEFGDSFVQD